MEEWKENKYVEKLHLLYIGTCDGLDYFHKPGVHANQHSMENDINKIWPKTEYLTDLLSHPFPRKISNIY